jgi:hypothetical protein
LTVIQPVPVKVMTFPEIVAAPDVTVNVTGNPEDAEADNVSGVPKTPPGGVGNEIVCAV